MPDLTLPLEKKWDIDLGVSATYPLIAGGRVFVVLPPTSSNTNGPASSLIAFDANTGHVLWGPVAIPAGVYGWAAACYDNGRIFVNNAGSVAGDTGVMTAYSAANGALLWTTNLPGQYSFSSAPTALNGYVYTGGAGDGGTIYCVRETDGRGIWSKGVENGDSSSPVVTSTSVYAGYACGQTFAFNAFSGTQLWHLSTGCEGGGGVTSALYNNNLFIRNYYDGSTATFFKAAELDSATGNVVKSFIDEGPLAFDNNMLFGVKNAALTATQIGNWTTAWTVNTTADAPVTAPTVVNGIVYVGTKSGKLIGYDENTSAVATSIDLGSTPSPTSESNTDIAAGDGLIVVPAGTHLIAVGSQYTLESLTPDKTSVIGGARTSFVVTLTQKAPVGGALVHITSSDPSVSVPANVPFPQGATVAGFSSTSLRVTRPTNVKITATFNGTTYQSILTVLPDGVTSMTFDNNPVSNGGTATGTLTLAYPAPAGGVAVSLATSFAPLAQTNVSTILIPAGATTGTFTVNTGKVLASFPITIGARSANSTVLSGTLTLVP